MDKKNDSQNYHARKEIDSRRMWDTQGNTKELNKRKGSSLSIGKTR